MIKKTLQTLVPSTRMDLMRNELKQMLQDDFAIDRVMSAIERYVEMDDYLSFTFYLQDERELSSAVFKIYFYTSNWQLRDTVPVRPYDTLIVQDSKLSPQARYRDCKVSLLDFTRYFWTVFDQDDAGTVQLQGMLLKQLVNEDKALKLITGEIEAYIIVNKTVFSFTTDESITIKMQVDITNEGKFLLRSFMVQY